MAQSNYERIGRALEALKAGSGGTDCLRVSELRRRDPVGRVGSLGKGGESEGGRIGEEGALWDQARGVLDGGY